MGFYTRHILPQRIVRLMSNENLVKDRAWVTQHAYGTVLEVGFGSGLNLPFYKPAVRQLYALDPSRELFQYAAPYISKALFPVKYICGEAEYIPLPNHSIDVVVSTWSLCSIANPQRALREIHRVLKPEGTLSFAEHGKSPRRFFYWWQNILTPVTKYWNGNCHLNRDIISLIEESFILEESISSGKKYRPLHYNYRGVAKLRV